jgi:hypothetical protein
MSTESVTPILTIPAKDANVAWDPALWSVLPKEILAKEILPRVTSDPRGFHKARCVNKHWERQSNNPPSEPYPILRIEKPPKWWWLTTQQHKLLYGNQKPYMNHATTVAANVYVVKGHAICDMSIVNNNDVPGKRHDFIEQGMYRVEFSASVSHLKRLIEIHDAEFQQLPASDEKSKEAAPKLIPWFFGDFKDFQRTKPQQGEARITIKNVSKSVYVPRNEKRAKEMFRMYRLETPTLTWEQFYMLDGEDEWYRWEEDIDTFDEETLEKYFLPGESEGYNFGREDEAITFPAYNWYLFRKTTALERDTQGTMSVWMSDNSQSFTITQRIFNQFNSEFPLPPL